MHFEGPCIPKPSLESEARATLGAFGETTLTRTRIGASEDSASEDKGESCRFDGAEVGQPSSYNDISRNILSTILFERRFPPGQAPKL
jgi:hypothetical protein